MSDAEIRERAKRGMPKLRDLFAQGLTLRTVKRMALCGNIAARAALGWRNQWKKQVHTLDVLWAMWHDCPEKVVEVQSRITVVEMTSGRRRKDGGPPHYKDLCSIRGCCPKGPRSKRQNEKYILAQKLGFCVYGSPAWWWIGRELAKLGRTNERPT